MSKDHMEISLLKALLSNISSFLNLSSFENINSEPVQKYYQRAEEILKLLKPILNAIVDSEITSDEVLSNAFEGLGLSIEELREQFESWQPLLSKVYFVLQVESLVSKIRNSSLDIFQFLKSSHQHLPDELSSASLEHCLQKIKHVGYEQTSSVIREATRDQVDSVGPSSEILVKIAESLSLRSNQEILIEAVALEKLKENAEQAEKTAEAEFIDQMIGLVTRMHDRLVLIKQSQTCSPVPIPADFCCPLSLELMTDPVIVASGQIYERAFIKKWIDLGLTVCPKTQQTLVHTNLIPNYTVKALIANWCESNNMKLPDPMKLKENAEQVEKTAEAIPNYTVKALIANWCESNNVKLPDPMKLKENAEQAEKTAEAEFIDQMNGLVTHMHDRLVLIKQSQTCSPVPIPADFCCPLSLELMIDPVIVASGKTYERAFIKKRIDLGLTVCPKTRQTLAHTNLIPNYTVKALIANWCESNYVKLPDPMKSMSLNQPYHLLVHGESGLSRDSNSFPHSRSCQPMSPESRSTGQSGKNLNASSGLPREGTFPLHPCSTSEASLPSIAGNGEGLDVARISLNSAEDRSNLEQRMDSDSVGKPPISPSTKEFRNVGQSSLNDTISDSASSTLSNSDFPRGPVGDANETSEGSTHLGAYSSDVSGVVKSDLQPAAGSAIPQREPEFPPRLMDARSRSQTIWRRPSERFIPRIVSSPVIENRADLSGIETQVKKLVEDLKSTSVNTQREATVQLRLLAKHNMDNRIIMANCGAISLLVDLLRSADTKTQENAVTALLNLSINDNNKAAIANANAIEPLIHVLETGSPEAKENSAATLFSLSVIEDNKVKIGRSGAIRPLVDLLGNGTPRGKKDAATALFNLSKFHENKARIVQAGAVRHLVDLMDPAAGMVDKATAVLANLATIPEGRITIEQERGIAVLVEVVELGSARGKQNAIAALLQLCTTSSRFCSMVLQEGAVPPLVALSQSGTPKTKEKAQGLLSYLRTNDIHGNAGRG